ncbi:Protein kinase-like domain containing protein, partial [Amanita muscaria]
QDTLDREFVESGLYARRMSQGVEVTLPSWTITRYEVDREEKIGIGFFSDVYKGKWRGRTVAIKVLAETTPRELFVKETEIWKSLHHPNVLELYGASSATSDPPWFF